MTDENLIVDGTITAGKLSQGNISIEFERGFRAEVTASGEVRLYGLDGGLMDVGKLATIEGVEPPRYAPNHKIVEDGDETEPCTVKAVAMVDDKIVYVCTRDSDNFLIVIEDERASDYTVVR